MSKPIRKGKVFVMLYAFYLHIQLRYMYEFYEIHPSRNRYPKVAANQKDTAGYDM